MSGLKIKKIELLCLGTLVVALLVLGTHFGGQFILPPPPGPTATAPTDRIKGPGKNITPTMQSTTTDSSPSPSPSPATAHRRAVPTVTAGRPAKLPALESKLSLRLPLVINEQHYPNNIYHATASTNDPYSDQSWETLAGVTAARSIASGSYTPKVAVIDSGIALNHQDLTGLWLTNEGESGATTVQSPSRLNCSDRALPVNRSCNNLDDNLDGIIDNESGATSVENLSQLNCTDQGKTIDKSCNNFDDDDNQLTDDYQGYDFANADRSVMPGEIEPLGGGVEHGTLVSGVIAATNNNGVGIAGVAASARILPLQALEDGGSGYTLSIADAIYYAVSRDVDIINLSLGGDQMDLYLKQAIDYANQQGVVVVAAAGNDGCACVSYPAAFSAVIAVGAIDSSGQPASFSNRGDFVDITAPGTSLYTTSWSSDNRSTLYQSASGTSLSTPVVAGALAQLLNRDPTASPLQLKAMLYEQTDQTNMSTLRDTSRGYGRIKLDRSVTRAITPHSSEMVYSFYAIRSGRETNQSWGARESSKPTTFYSCNQGTGHPGMTVYELNGSGTTLFTASEVDRDSALDAGFTASRLSDWCVLLNNDRPLIRSMNIFAELKNSYPKE